MNLDAEIIRTGLIYYLLLVICIAIHEWAHAIVADRLGDHTPAAQGRVTLNPLVHLDPIGTGLIPLANIFLLRGSSFGLIGWGRPVQINLGNFPPHRRMLCDLLVTLAGPLSNAVLALLGVLMAVASHGHRELTGLFLQFIQLNVVMVVFNLLPIPPLDGSHVMRYIVGLKEETYLRLSQVGGILLLVLINVPAFQKAMGELIGWGMQPYLRLYHALIS